MGGLLNEVFKPLLAAPGTAEQRPARGMVEAFEDKENSAEINRRQPAGAKPAGKPGGKRLAGGRTNGSASSGAGSCLFFDEEAGRKQQRGWTSWINFVIDPFTTKPASPAPNFVDASLSQLDAERNAAVLRQRSVQLLHGPEMRPPLCKLEEAVDEGSIKMKPKLKVAQDVGQRENLLNLLCCYSPQWLLLGVEILSGTACTPSGGRALEISAVRRLLHKHLLTAPAFEPAPAAGRHHDEAKRANEQAALAASNASVIKRVLALVMFLDAAKGRALLPLSLFVSTAQIKASKQMAAEFCKLCLSATTGDLPKLLATFGAPLSHEQTSRDEYEYGVGALPGDMSNGASLCRLLERAAAMWTEEGATTTELSGAVRGLPSPTRMQKLHNVGVALAKMEVLGVVRAEELEPTKKAIVDGSMDALASVLWELASKVAVPSLACDAAVLCECTSASGAIADPSGLEAPLACMPLLQWIHAIASSHGVPLRNLRDGLRDGRALCALLHHYLPALLPARLVKAQGATPAQRVEAFFGALAALGSVPSVLVASDVLGRHGPDEHMAALLLAHLFSRLSAVRRERGAACALQTGWRRSKGLWVAKSAPSPNRQPSDVAGGRGEVGGGMAGRKRLAASAARIHGHTSFGEESGERREGRMASRQARVPSDQMPAAGKAAAVRSQRTRSRRRWNFRRWKRPRATARRRMRRRRFERRRRRRRRRR